MIKKLSPLAGCAQSNDNRHQLVFCYGGCILSDKRLYSRVSEIGHVNTMLTCKKHVQLEDP